MAAEGAIAPIRAADRIAVIDVLRGFAILGIFHLNLVIAANVPWEVFVDPRVIGWSEADRAAFWFFEVITTGTMRGTLQLLFGAGLMLFAAKAMTPEGPVGVADLWYRRNLWLMAFGAFNALVLLWPGDILFAYGLAALFIFPFRLLKARWLLAIGCLYLAHTAWDGWTSYRGEAAFAVEVAEAEARITRGLPLDEDAAEAIEARDERLAPAVEQPQVAEIAAARRAAQGDPLNYVVNGSNTWWELWADGTMRFFVTEAFFVMLIGMALFKWGFIQGGASTRTYWLAMIGGYAFGFGVRAWGMPTQMEFGIAPVPSDPFGGIPRVAISIAHIAALNVLMKSRAAGALSATLGAAGRLAFTLYLMQSFVTSYIIVAPWGLNVFDGVGWAQVLWMAAIVMALQLVFAAWYVRRYRFGPLEWLWRSLSHWKRQPMRLPRGDGSYGPQP